LSVIWTEKDSDLPGLPECFETQESEAQAIDIAIASRMAFFNVTLFMNVCLHRISGFDPTLLHKAGRFRREFSGSHQADSQHKTLLHGARRDRASKRNMRDNL
jgi:hypothetical protein